jgi:hypothetical protein
MNRNSTMFMKWRHGGYYNFHRYSSWRHSNFRIRHHSNFMCGHHSTKIWHHHGWHHHRFMNKHHHYLSR